MDTKHDSYYSTPLEKGLRILKLFAEGHDLSLQDVSQKAEISKTSAYRFCNTFTQLGYLKKDPRTKLLTLGTNAFLLGNGLIRGFDLYQVVKPFIDEVSDTYNVAIDSILFDGKSVAVLYRRDAKDTVKYYRLPMTLADLTCTALGKAILAFLPEQERRKLLEKLPRDRRTEKTLVSIKDIMADLRLTKERGYALSNEEFFPGFIAIAAPFIDLNTRVVRGAVCFDFTKAQYPIGAIKKDYSQAIIKLAADISQAVSD